MPPSTRTAPIDNHVSPVDTRAAIQILPSDVIEQIAAGEVVERPVSVVRELLDNALDAGAHDIRIDIRGGGLRSIRVSDDGMGIPAHEVELAFRHHATSKIRAADDLIRVSSLGFRGEALPSIATVAELSLVTATAAAQVGVQLEIRHGAVVSREYVARPPGTTVTVRWLFATTPARLKFIGNARAESAHISQLVRRYALAHAGTRFTLTLDGHPSVRTSGGGLTQAVEEIFGPAIARTLLPLGASEVENQPDDPVQPADPERLEIGGLIAGPQVTRSNRNGTTLLVNNRCVSSKALLAAFEDGYRPLLPRGRHPLAIISLRIPRVDLDVNVHPSKAEIKMVDEPAIGAALRLAVRATLGRSLSGPLSDHAFVLGMSRGDEPVQAELPRLLAEHGPEWEIATRDRLRAAHVHGQVQGSLILIEDTSGLYLVDQHRAHERAIYELLLRRHSEGRAGQLLLEPLHIELSTYQLDRLEPRLPDLAALGFDCEWFGGRSFLVRSVPVIPESADLTTVVEDLFDLAGDDQSDWRHRLLTSLACRSATRRGRPLTVAGARELITLLADTESPAVCPHGSPVILHLSGSFLKRQFDW